VLGVVPRTLLQAGALAARASRSQRCHRLFFLYNPSQEGKNCTR